MLLIQFQNNHYNELNTLNSNIKKIITAKEKVEENLLKTNSKNKN